MGTIGRQILRARTARSRTQDELAAHLGISRISVAQWEGVRATNPAPAKLPLIAAFLQVPVDWLLSEDAVVPDPNGSAAAAATPQPRSVGQIVTAVIPDRDLTAFDRLMPVFSGAQGGNGKLIIGTDPIDRVKMPAFLENVSGAYGLLIDGDSMIPAFFPGDTALVNPHLRPQRGRNVILYHTPPNGQEAEAIIKQLNGWNDREWDLEQWNPPRQWKEHRAEWPICHRVVGKYDAV